MGIEICLIKTFFQISSFVFSRKNKHIEVTNPLSSSFFLVPALFHEKLGRCFTEERVMAVQRLNITLLIM